MTPDELRENKLKEIRDELTQPSTHKENWETEFDKRFVNFTEEPDVERDNPKYGHVTVADIKGWNLKQEIWEGQDATEIKDFIQTLQRSLVEEAVENLESLFYEDRLLAEPEQDIRDLITKWKQRLEDK